MFGKSGNLTSRHSNILIVILIGLKSEFSEDEDEDAEDGEMSESRLFHFVNADSDVEIRGLVAKSNLSDSVMMEMRMTMLVCRNIDMSLNIID